MPDVTVADLARDAWDVVVVGGGHNGLTAAAYSRGPVSRSLVLERRDQLGGACTLERPFADQRFVMSPCAYLVGLLHPLVIAELDLPRRGYRTFPVDPTQWTPFEDGTALAQWHDEQKTARAVAAISARRRRRFPRVRRTLRAHPRPAARRSARRRVARRRTRPFRARRPLRRRPRSARRARRRVDRRRRRAPRARRAAAHRAARPGCDRYLRRAPRPRDARGSTPITVSGSSAAGRSWRAGSVGCRSSSPTAAREAGAVLAVGVPVAAITPGEGVATRRRHADPRRRRRQQRRSGAHARAARRGWRQCAGRSRPRSTVGAP